MVKIRKFFSVIVLMFLLFTSASSVYGTNIANTDELIFNFSFDMPDFEKIEMTGELFDRITIDGLPNSNDYQKPCLPIKPLKILLPAGKDVDNIHISTGKKIYFEEKCNIQIGGKVVPIVQNIKINNNVEPTKIRSDYSSSLYDYVGIYYSRGFPILHINLYPVQYDPSNEKICFYENMELVIETKNSVINGAFRGFSKDFDVIKKIVDNPKVLDSYKSFIKNNENLDAVDYVIITSRYFKNSNLVDNFQNLIACKQTKGLNCNIVTVEEIINNNDYSVNGAWGDNNPSNPFYQKDVSNNIELFDDTPARIRNFIRYAYTAWGTDYVLLGGDADVLNEEDNIVPLRGLFANESGLPLNGLISEEDDIPSDVYYACLDGCFNFDLDEHFGECADRNDVDDSIDEADLYSEVWVGRACIDSKEELETFVFKTIEYEELGYDPYIENILFVGESLGSSFYTPWGGDYKDLMQEFVPEQYTLQKFYDRDHEDNHWYPEELFEYICSHQPQIINHDGHGNHRYILKTSGENIATLQNEKTFFIYSHSCLTGSFDNYNCWSGYQEDDCIAEILTCEIPHGAYACILNARFGLGSEDTIEAPSGAYDESFYKALFVEDIKELGAANHFSKEDNVWRIDENGYRWCYYQTNLFGDPNLAIKDPNDVMPSKPEKPNGPTSGDKGISYTYTTVSTNPNGGDLYYWFDWNDGTTSGWVGPFSSGETASSSHAWSKQGTYQIKVKSKNNDGTQSEWSDSLSVSMPRNKFANLPFFEKILNFLNFLKIYKI